MDDATVLAYDLGGTKLAAALVTRAGRIIAEVAAPVGDPRPASVLREMVAMAGTLSDATRPRPARVGLAVPGLVRRDGTVWAPNLGWARVAIGARLTRRLGMPVAVDSDRNAAVLGEAWRGAARGHAHVVVVIVGTGIGAGILSDGRLVRGAHELSGCVGWMVVGPWERARHGRLGYLESVAAGPAIGRAATAASGVGPATRPAAATLRRGQTMTAADLARAARSGDAAARRVFREAGRHLGLAAGNLVSLFDPEVLVFSGGLALAAPLWFDTMRETALATCQPLAARRVRFTLSRLGHRANLLGAARLALDLRAAPRPPA